MNDKLNLICAKCNHEWQETYPLPMNITAFVARLDGTLCPKCNNKKIYIKTGPKNEAAVTLKAEVLDKCN